MRLSDKWKDYELIDTSDGERLERWGDIILIRPDPQIIWSSEKKNPLWYSAHARYHRSNRGGGSWEQYKKVPDRWTVNYGDLVSTSSLWDSSTRVCSPNRQLTGICRRKN